MPNEQESLSAMLAEYGIPENATTLHSEETGESSGELAKQAANEERENLLAMLAEFGGIGYHMQVAIGESSEIRRLHSNRKETAEGNRELVDATLQHARRRASLSM
jgi:hypothetical protein